MPISEVYNRDCLEAMREMKDKQFDLAIVDPPYGINAPNMAATPLIRSCGTKRLNGGSGKLKNRTLNTSNIEWDNQIPDAEYFEHLFRISEYQIIWGGNYFPLPPSRCFVCWDKVQPWENFSQVEFAWTSFDMPAMYIKCDNRTGDKIHPTQKPIAVYKELYRRFAKAGMNIIDTHLGSGSNRIAAYKMGFDFTAYEIDAIYYEAQEKRFKEAIAEPLFTQSIVQQAILL